MTAFVLCDSLTFNTPPNALPVESPSFTVEAKNNKEVLIQWITNAEENNDYFEVLRRSENKAFESIGRVEGQGNSLELEVYKVIDSEPNPGHNYYQIKQVDFDGKFTVSEIRSAFIRPKETIKLFPNPAKDEINLILKEEAEATIYNVDGKLLLTTLINDLSTSSITINHLPKGLYLLKVKQSNDIHTLRFIKE